MTSLMVVGSLHWDVVVKAPHIPAPDETVSGECVNYVFGGKGGNQAIAGDQHGAVTHFVGRVGRDAFGTQILNRLNDSKINLDGLQTGHGASGMSVAIVDKNGDYGATIVSGENLCIDADTIQFPKAPGILLLQNEIDEKVNIAVAKPAKELGAQVWFNAAPARKVSQELLKYVDVLIVNRVEAAFYKDYISGPVRGQFTVIKTLGELGVSVHQIGQDTIHQKAFEVDVLSTHGAGDMFAGALAARVLSGYPIEQAIRYAQGAAALHISSPLETRGAITPDQVLAFTKTE